MILTWEKICTVILSFLEVQLCSPASETVWRKSSLLLFPQLIKSRLKIFFYSDCILKKGTWIFQFLSFRSSAHLSENTQSGSEAPFSRRFLLSNRCGFLSRSTMSPAPELFTENAFKSTYDIFQLTLRHNKILSINLKNFFFYFCINFKYIWLHM